MKHASLFSGIGGFDLAAQWMGWENVFQVEIDPFCQKVLEKNFPNTKRYGDIKQFDGSEWSGKIDILTGGFPCQSFSLAGKGAVDLSLWKEMFRIVGHIRPKVIVAENVYGILARKKGMALSTVYDDLESEAYTTMPPLIIPACAEGAWHQRDRVWIVAYSPEFGNGRLPIQQWREGEEGSHVNGDFEEVLSNAESQGRTKRRIRGGNETEQSELDYSPRIQNWYPWSVEPLVGGRIHGIPNRVDRIKSLGNAVVPQVVFEIFKAIEACSNDATNVK